MLALSFEMDMPIHFIAPAFGFQKNIPYPNNEELKKMVEPIWSVCESFGVSIGFHSGSGKSAENYQVAGKCDWREFRNKNKWSIYLRNGCSIA